MKHKNRKKIPVKRLFILGLVLALAGGGYWLYQNRDSQSADQAIIEQADDSIDFGPPTEEEVKAGDEQKAKNEEEEKQQNQQTSGDASVIITDAGQYDNVIEVRSFVSDHYEDGTCTITFRRGSQTVTKTTEAYRDASTTICTNPLVPRGQFPAAGTWQVTVSYKAPGASGQSEVKTITIE